MGSYRKLIADPKASASYQMAGPFDIIARDGQHGRTKGPSENDFLAAYYNALRYVITGEEAHAATALKIIRAYANRLQAIDGHDGPLCAGLQGFILVNACELLRYEYPAWTKDDTRATESMLRRAFLPVLDEFDRLSPYANGNWGAAVNKMRLALAVYTNDAKQYARAHRGTRDTILLSAGITLAVALPLVIFAAPAVRLFSKDASVIEYGVLFLRANTFFLLANCVNHTLAGALRGRGDSRAPMLIMIGCFVALRQAYLFVVTRFIANTPLLVGLGYPVGWVSCCVIEVSYYYLHWYRRIRAEL